MRILYHPDDWARIGQWMLDKIAHVESWSPGHTAMAVERDGEIVAACIFEHFTGHDIDVSLAVASKGATPGFARAVFRYVFNQLTCRRISCEIAERNTAMRHIAGRLGFKDEGVKRDAVPGDNLVMMGMLRSECRFL